MKDKLVTLSVKIPDSIRRSLRLRAAKLDVKIQELVTNILQADIDRKGA